MKLELEENERKMLGELLESAVSDLSTEIGHTDAADYRNELKERRAAVRALIERLQSSSA